MRIEQKQKLKKGLSIAAVITVFLFLIIFINVLTRHYSDETIRVATKTVLESWSGESVTLQHKQSPGRSGISYSRAFTTILGGQKSSVYIVTITGKTGPYSAVFAVEENRTAEFCGLLLQPDKHTDYEQLGISAGVLNKWTQRITRLNSGSGVQGEK